MFRFGHIFPSVIWHFWQNESVGPNWHCPGKYGQPWQNSKVCSCVLPQALVVHLWQSCIQPSGVFSSINSGLLQFCSIHFSDPIAPGLQGHSTRVQHSIPFSAWTQAKKQKNPCFFLSFMRPFPLMAFSFDYQLVNIMGTATQGGAMMECAVRS